MSWRFRRGRVNELVVACCNKTGFQGAGAKEPPRWWPGILICGWRWQGYANLGTFMGLMDSVFGTDASFLDAWQHCLVKLYTTQRDLPVPHMSCIHVACVACVLNVCCSMYACMYAACMLYVRCMHKHAQESWRIFDEVGNVGGLECQMTNHRL